MQFLIKAAVVLAGAAVVSLPSDADAALVAYQFGASGTSQQTVGQNFTLLTANDGVTGFNSANVKTPENTQMTISFAGSTSTSTRARTSSATNSSDFNDQDFSKLYNSFVGANSLVVTLGGLQANTAYDLRIWSFDPNNNNSFNRVPPNTDNATYTRTTASSANGSFSPTTSSWIGYGATGSYPGSGLTANGNSMLGTLTTNGSGQLSFTLTATQTWQSDYTSNAAATRAPLNGFTIEAVPEPTALGLLGGAMVLGLRRRRNA